MIRKSKTTDKMFIFRQDLKDLSLFVAHTAFKAGVELLLHEVI